MESSTNRSITDPSRGGSTMQEAAFLPVSAESAQPRVTLQSRQICSNSNVDSRPRSARRHASIGA